MSLKSLVAFAGNNNARSSRAMYTLSVEEARLEIVIKDGFKEPQEDGTQKLTLVLGRYVIALDAISPKATYVTADKASVAPFTKTLEAEIAKGTFDEAILDAQSKAEASAIKAKADAVTARENEVAEPVAEVDTSAL